MRGLEPGGRSLNRAANPSCCNEENAPVVPIAPQKITVLLARLDPGEPPPDMNIDVGRNCEKMGDRGGGFAQQPSDGPPTSEGMMVISIRRFAGG